MLSLSSTLRTTLWVRVLRICLLKTWHANYNWRHSRCRLIVVFVVITYRTTRTRHVKKCAAQASISVCCCVVPFSVLALASSLAPCSSLSVFVGFFLSHTELLRGTHRHIHTHLSVICVRWFLMHLRPGGSSHSNLHQHPLLWLFVCVSGSACPHRCVSVL